MNKSILLYLALSRFILLYGKLFLNEFLFNMLYYLYYFYSLQILN